ncbi:hypothetical protein BKA69DRAFT_1051154 [Paraphysoderma sedebokerense]|nr:hypothetical protein BKA69DRAFT_1051154 [Paraphysoderma sedebokerense]
MEWSHILNTQSDDSDGAFDSIIKGDYLSVLRSPAARSLFELDPNIYADDIQNLVETNDIQVYLAKGLALYKQSDSNPTQLLAIAVACLYTFIQINWTGPSLEDFRSIHLLPNSVHSQESLIRRRCLEGLSVDDEEAYHLCREPMLLLIAKILLVEGKSKLDNLKTLPWWTARVLFLQQRLLQGKSSALKEYIITCMNEIGQTLPAINDLSTRTVYAHYHLEFGLIYHYYQDDRQALEQFRLAQSSSGLKFSVSGLLGKRTKFQQTSYSQLVVLAESIEETEETNPSELPTSFDINDEELLEKIKFDDENTQGQVKKNLRVIDQCILLAFCLNIKNTNPDHGITIEQMMPYVQRVLENPNNWTVHTMALFLRSRLESAKSKTVERAVLQMQALVDQIPCLDSTASERLQYFWGVLEPSVWDLEAEVAEKMMSLGVVKTALEIYQRLELWEKVVNCHILTERTDKAEDLVLRLLKESPNSPKFLCILGDLRKDPTLYWDAWNKSNQRFSRAMRSLGAHYYKVSDFPQSLECYERALKINPLYEQSWFMMGCAAMSCENWEKGLIAFSKCTSLDHENSEAWSNMAAIYIRLKQKKEAHRALSQALRHKYDSWKMWTNYLYVSFDLGLIDDIIYAFTRIVEIRIDEGGIKSDMIDVELLTFLVDAVVRDYKEEIAESTESNVQTNTQRRVQRVQGLLDKITSNLSNYHTVWKIASNFYLHLGKYRKAIDAALKRYRAVSAVVDCYTDAKAFQDVVDAVVDLVDCYRNYGDNTVDIVDDNGNKTGEEPVPSLHF